MEKEPHYKKVLLKISGEALARPLPLLTELLDLKSRMLNDCMDLGDDLANREENKKSLGIYRKWIDQIGNVLSQCSDSAKYSIDLDFLNKLTAMIGYCQEKYGVKFGIVAGGGNFWRGAKHDEIPRDYSDQIGMLATLMNSRAIHSSFEKHAIESRLMTQQDVRYYGEPFTPGRLKSHLEKGRIIIFAEGTGRPRHTTDSGAVERAAEMGADIVFKLTDVDYIYSADPKKDYDAKPYLEIPYSEAVNLKAMDGTATQFACDNDIPIRLFNINPIENLERALFDEVGTLMSPKVKKMKFLDEK